MGLVKLSATLLTLAGSAIAADLQPIQIKGSKFFYQNGTQFYMKGVAYQQEFGPNGSSNKENTKYSDPLADEAACKRDVPLLKELGTNTIRTYAIDPKQDHRACMQLLNDAGIYVISDLSEPATSIISDDPQWDTRLFDRYTAVIDDLAQYPNVLGFFAGNEVSHQENTTAASAFVKAAVRDTKAYIKANVENKKFHHWMGVGYAANDNAGIRYDIGHYFNCDNADDSIEFFGYNIYSWCGEASSFQVSGYDKQVDFFKSYSVPVFFAEYGCNTGGAANRKFKETAALYSDAMTGVFSGGIVYMYFQEANDYGLVKIENNRASKVGGNFDALKSEVTKATPKAVDINQYQPSGQLSECPALSNKWLANKALPPTPDKRLCDCMTKSRSCVAKSGIDTKTISNIFGFICGKSPASCAGITANGTTGIYGAYSMCDPEAKLNYALDAYYNSLNKAKDACNFDGAAQVVSPKSDDSCSSALNAANEVNKQVATATSAVGGGGSKPTGKSDGSFAVHGAPVTRIFSVGDFAIGLYLAVALFAGAGMVAL